MSDSDVDVEADSGLLSAPKAASKASVDDSICPRCKGTTYVGQTIMCETCERSVSRREVMSDMDIAQKRGHVPALKGTLLWHILTFGCNMWSG